MNEKYQAHPLRERELTRRLGELTVLQMDDIISLPESGLKPEEGFFDEEASLKLSGWMKENRDNLVATLSESENNYTPEELDDTAMKSLVLCLSTPRFVYAQDRRDRTRDNSQNLKRELVEYGEAMRDAVRANPHTPRSRLIAALEGAVLWAGMPRSLHDPATEMFRGITNGVRGELFMEQLVQSKAAQEAGIIYRNTSTADDLKGKDVSLLVPIQRNGHTVMVPVSLDAKYNLQRIRRRLPDNEQNLTYHIASDGVTSMWPGVTFEEMGDRMMLDQASVEEKGEAIIPTLREIAEKIYEQTIQMHMGKTALGNEQS